jgi:hypothetical protein
MIAPKRQVVRLLTGQLDGFAAEDAAVLHAGLVSSSYVTVDDTGARHSHNPGYPANVAETLCMSDAARPLEAHN